jgi:hypothetical protein
MSFLGLTSLGVIHTAISLVALVVGIAAMLRMRRIVHDSLSGRVYFWATVLSCVTGFGIFQHGGFGKPHALGVMTLLVLGAIVLMHRRRMFGERAPAVLAAAYTLTLFFHFVPGVTETFTRLPLGAPLFSSPDDPKLAATLGVVALVFLVLGVLQWRHLRQQRADLPFASAA